MLIFKIATAAVSLATAHNRCGAALVWRCDNINQSASPRLTTWYLTLFPYKNLNVTTICHFSPIGLTNCQVDHLWFLGSEQLPGNQWRILYFWVYPLYSALKKNTQTHTQRSVRDAHSMHTPLCNWSHNAVLHVSWMQRWRWFRECLHCCFTSHYWMN